MPILKNLKLEDITYHKELLVTITSSSMEKNFYDQAIDSDIKQYEEIRKLTTVKVKVILEDVVISKIIIDQ